eukprot:3136587-Prymnesium_polylepis.1
MIARRRSRRVTPGPLAKGSHTPLARPRHERSPTSTRTTTTSPRWPSRSLRSRHSARDAATVTPSPPHLPPPAVTGTLLGCHLRPSPSRCNPPPSTSNHPRPSTLTPQATPELAAVVSAAAVEGLAASI